VNSMQ